MLLMVPAHTGCYHQKEAGFTLYAARSKQGNEFTNNSNFFATSNKFQLEFQAKILLHFYVTEKQSPPTETLTRSRSLEALLLRIRRP